MTTHDVRLACDVLRPTYDASDGVDGRASIEGRPATGLRQPRRTTAEARACGGGWTGPTCLSRSAAAREGLPAITACLAEGISINVTLIFSLTRYDEVIDAFLEGLERARQAGHDLAPIASVASFFVSRVDTEIDARLDKTGTAAAAALRGRPRSPTRGWPTSTTSGCSPRRGGPRWRRPGPGRSARCGPRLRSRTRLIPTPCT